MATVDPEDSFKAKIQYLARDDKFQLVKPYHLYLKYETDIARTNTTPDHRLVQVRNARNVSIPSREMFFEWGFAQLRLDCSLIPEEYWSQEKVEETLYPKYKSLARSLFPDAAQVEVLEHAVRKRHPSWDPETSLRHELDTNQPSDYVHIDMTASSAEKCAMKEFKIHPEQYPRFVVVNFWKPIRGPVCDYPLTLCDRRTVDYASQATGMDTVARNYINENTRIYFDENHEWYYFDGLQADEVVAFMQHDSAARDRAGVPHTAFQDPRTHDIKQLRESIEARVFIYFD